MSDELPLGPIDESFFKPGARLPSSAQRPRRSAELSVLAVISLVLGAISPLLICVCYTALVPSLAAIVTGHIAHFRIRRSAGALTGAGFSIAGLALGYVTFTITAALLGFYIAGLWPPGADDAPVTRAPGEVELLEVERQIVSDDRGNALGNTPEARELARRFAEEMKVLDETMFTQTDATVKLSGGQYVTWCELRDGQCAFVVHVPEYRRFDTEAKHALADLAWMTAQGAVSDRLEPGDDLAVGLKGVLLYGAVMVGRVEDADENSGAGMFESDADKSALHPFFQTDRTLGSRPQQGESSDRVVMEPARIPEMPPPVGVLPPDFVPVEPPLPPVRPPVLPVTPPPPAVVPDPGETRRAIPDDPPSPVAADPPEAQTQPDRPRNKIRPDTVEEALEFLQGDDEFLQRQAVSFLGQQEPDAPNSEVVDALFQQLERDHTGSRLFVATALRPWVTVDDVDRLEPLLDDENVLVQTHVVETISLLGTKEAAEVLAERLTDRNHAAQVSFRLAQMGDVAERPVLALLREQDIDPAAASQIVYVLGEVGGRDSLRVLRRIAASRRHPQRFAAGSAAQKIQRRLAD